MAANTAALRKCLESVHRSSRSQKNADSPTETMNEKNGRTGTHGLLNPEATVDIVMEISDYTRNTFLVHAKHLYDEALEFSSRVSLTVIPRFPQPLLSTKSMTGSPMSPWMPLQNCGLRLEDIHQHSEFGQLYHSVAVGGTFDKLHSGHKLLLSYAALYAADKLRVGIADDALLSKKKFKDCIQSNEERMDLVTQFLKCIRQDLELQVVTITDMFGGTDVLPDIDAIILSVETNKSLSIINDARRSNNLKPIKGITIPNVARHDGSLISSTELRESQILTNTSSTQDEQKESQHQEQKDLQQKAERAETTDATTKSKDASEQEVLKPPEKSLGCC